MNAGARYCAACRKLQPFVQGRGEGPICAVCTNPYANVGISSGISVSGTKKRGKRRRTARAQLLDARRVLAAVAAEWRATAVDPEKPPPLVALALRVLRGEPLDPI